MFFGEAIQAASRAKINHARVIPFTAETTSPKPGVPFVPQWGLITCQALAICLLCSRRAGKTAGLVYRTAKLSWENPGRRTLYIHHTLENGRNQFFKATSMGAEHAEVALLDVLDKHGIAYQEDNVSVNVTLENGSFIQIVGCDNIAQVRKKLGYHWDEVIIDEAQEHDHDLLELLVKKTLLPTLIDTMGTFILSGTPSSVEAGLWFETINNPRYQHLHWTMMDNPIIKLEAIVESMGKAGYTIDFANPQNNDPLVQREVFGLQVVDHRDLIYPYSEAKNGYPLTGIPELESKTWRYAMGIDIGGANEDNDRDAVVVFGWRMDDPKHEIFERECWEARQLDSEEFCERVVETYFAWRPMMSVCGDTGGAGANKDLAWMAKRMAGMEFTPKPTSVDLSTRMLNDELRAGRMKVDPKGLIARDAKLCSKKSTYHSDVMPAARYALHGALNWLAKEVPPPADPNDADAIWARRMARWNQQEIAKKRTGPRIAPPRRHPLAS
jgi:hypothetical protein